MLRPFLTYLHELVIVLSSDKEKMDCVSPYIDLEQATREMHPEGKLLSEVDSMRALRDIPFHCGYFANEE